MVPMCSENTFKNDDTVFVVRRTFFIEGSDYIYDLSVEGSDYI